MVIQVSINSNREIAMSFFDLVLLGEIRKWFDEYTRQEFIHHNQYFKVDCEALILAMKDYISNSPMET